MHPPFGIALYNLRSVAPRSVSTVQIYWGAFPFVGIQILLLVLLISIPQIVSKTPTVPIDAKNIGIEIPAPVD